ncbi:MAG: hypothetical protein A2Z97_01930 [Bdellovibrionales bacterium GWB1_52_6]|nr:MAG: hypothetical protein A2Z97_01930 [Bdellovibrionales bacterium GWB1_52_6]
MIRALFFALILATTTIAATSTALPNASTQTPKEARLESLVQKALPAPVQQIHPGGTSRAQVEKLLGKPLSDSTATEQFYAISKTGTQSNDLAIGYDSKNTVRYFYYTLPSGPAEKKFPLSAFKPLIPKSSLKTAHEKMRKDATEHEAGRTFDIQIDEKGLSLQFAVSDDPTLNAVLSWKPGKRMP